MAGFKTTFHGAARRSMILMMMADGTVDDAEVEAICSVYEQLSGERLTRKQVDEDIVRARLDGRTIHQFLSVLVHVMSDQDKVTVLRAAHLVAAADGRLHVEEERMLEEIARALQLSPAQVRDATQG